MSILKFLHAAADGWKVREMPMVDFYFHCCARTLSIHRKIYDFVNQFCGLKAVVVYAKCFFFSSSQNNSFRCHWLFVVVVRFEITCNASEILCLLFLLLSSHHSCRWFCSHCYVRSYNLNYPLIVCNILWTKYISHC